MADPTWRAYGAAGTLVTAGILITGALWLGRKDAQVRGEDMAECLSALAERQTLCALTGTNAPAWPTNRVTPYVLWSQTYNGLLVPARTLALDDNLSGTDDLLFWAGTDGLPADGADLFLSTSDPMQFTGTAERFGTSAARWLPGWSATNLPVRQALWALSTNAVPPLTNFTSGTVGYAGGNWWTASGLGTNPPKYACEFVRDETNAYVITAEDTAEYSVGQVFSFSGNYSTNYFGDTVKVRDYGDLRFYYELPDGSARWFLGRPSLDWISASPLWPDIGTLAKAGVGTSVTFAPVVTSNALAASQWIATNNLNQAAAALSNLTRTVWLLPPSSLSVTAGLARVSGLVQNMPVTNDIMVIFEEDEPGTAFFPLFAPSPSVASNYPYSGGAEPWLATRYSEIVFTYDRLSELDAFGFTGWYYADTTESRSLYGCRAAEYPSDFACLSNYVARYRVFMLSKVTASGSSLLPLSYYERGPRWSLIADLTAPTSVATFDVLPAAYDFGAVAITEESFLDFYGYIFSLYDSGPGPSEWPVEAGEDVRQYLVPLAFAVVVDWNWRHLNPSAAFEPEPFTPEWLSTNAP